MHSSGGNMQNTSIIGSWCIAKKVTNEQALIPFATITLLSLCKLILADWSRRTCLVKFKQETKTNNEEFGRPFYRGIFDGFWWAFVTMSTVGYVIYIFPHGIRSYPQKASRHAQIKSKRWESWLIWAIWAIFRSLQAITKEITTKLLSGKALMSPYILCKVSRLSKIISPKLFGISGSFFCHR